MEYSEILHPQRYNSILPIHCSNDNNMHSNRSIPSDKFQPVHHRSHMDFRPNWSYMRYELLRHHKTVYLQCENPVDHCSDHMLPIRQIASMLSHHLDWERRMHFRVEIRCERREISYAGFCLKPEDPSVSHLAD